MQASVLVAMSSSVPGFGSLQGTFGTAFSVSRVSPFSILAQMNDYPGYRTFTAIGTGGAEFKASMVSVSNLVPTCRRVH